MFYLFHGDDKHSQKERLEATLAKLGDPAMLDLNTTRFEGKMEFSALRQACDAVPFLAKRRVVIVEGLLGAKPGREFLDKLYDYLPTMPDTARLFFLEPRNLPANNKLLKLAKSADNGYEKVFARPEGNALNKWIHNRAQQHQATFTPQAVNMLAVNVGNNLAILDKEIEKLALYKGSVDAVTSDDVALLCPYAAEASIFELVDAVGNRNTRQAAILLQQKLTDGTDPFYLFAMIVRQFRLLIQVKEVAESGAKPPAVAKAVKIHSFVAGKLYRQCQQFSLPQLEQIYAHLLEMDVGVKTGRVDMTTSLNLLVSALTRT